MMSSLTTQISKAASPDLAVAACHSLLPLRRLLSHGLSLAELTQLATLYVPLAAPADAASSSFQAAALLAAGIDTATLALRSSGEPVQTAIDKRHRQGSLWCPC